MYEENLKKKIAETEEIIYRFLPEESGYQKTVISAMNYTMKAGGKRLRPLMMYLTYQMFGESDDAIYAFMAAIEMIHTYSLIHDDLPALDNDDYRRGKLTAHKKYGEDMAILAGDGLLNYAFEIAADTLKDRYGDSRIAKSLMILTKKPGIYGMIGGQTLDVELTGTPLKEDELHFIYRNKTGALIEAAMMVGALLGGASDEDVLLICDVASKVGMAFQIQDDILDVVGDKETLGKTIGSDAKNDKTTYVTIHGLEASENMVRRLSEDAIAMLKTLAYPSDELEALIRWMIDRQL